MEIILAIMALAVVLGWNSGQNRGARTAATSGANGGEVTKVHRLYAKEAQTGNYAASSDVARFNGRIPPSPNPSKAQL